MERWFALLAVLCCSGAQAASNWFTITGDPADGAVDTVQVDPATIRTDGARKVMAVRVSRAAERRNAENLPYRSYESQVAVDCRARRAGYTYAIFYAAPLWQGQPLRTNDYAGSPRPMLLRDVDPNPTQRIIRAACGTATG